MATLAAVFRRTEARPAREWVATEAVADPYRLRPLPGEDVYLYHKKIDNSRVIRQADPVARRRSARAVAGSFAAALLLMLLLLPHGLNVIAGYHIDKLEASNHQLRGERSRLELEESRLLSPERLNALAVELHYVDPDPNKVVYAGSPANDAVALNSATAVR